QGARTVRGPKAVVELRAQSRLDGGHEQGCRNSFPTDIPEHQTNPVFAQLEEVVIIAADRARGLADSIKRQAWNFRRRPGKQLCLDLARNLELALETKFLFGFPQQALHRGGHAVKSFPQRADLVICRNPDAVREITFLHSLRSVIKLVYGMSDRTCQADSNEERDAFDKEKDYGNYLEHEHVDLG